METQYLETLGTVLEYGSFSKAADSLCVTQSAVSQRIKFLEERYGLSLVDRSGAVVTATDAGRLVVKKARQILMLEKELENELKNLSNKSRLSLCCTPTFGIVYLPKVLNRFFLANSDDLDFKFVLNTPEQSLKGLLSNDFDMAVIEHCNDLGVKDAICQPLPPDELIFISSPALSMSGAEVTLDELLQQRLIARREGCSSRHLLLKNLAEFGKSMEDFKGSIVYDDLYLTIQTVMSGRGVAFVSRSLVTDQLRTGELTEHTVKGFSCTRFRTLVLNSRQSENRFLQNFSDCIKTVFAMSDATPPAAHS